jgi:hypothetical protein
MKKTITGIVLGLLLLAGQVLAGQAAKARDFNMLLGARWTGTLTYLNFSDGQRFSIPCELVITAVAGRRRAWEFSTEYPKEPQENEKSIFALSADGKTFRDETIVERRKMARGNIRIVTAKEGLDNNKPAFFRYTYLIAKHSFSIKKEVKYLDDPAAAFFERHTYAWTR